MIRAMENVDKEKVFDELMKKMGNEQQIIDEVMGNDGYILWLIDFFDRHKWCSNEVGFGTVSVEEKSNLEKLKYFRDGISRYANANYIYPTTLECGYGYFIKYRGVIFELSWMFVLGRNILFFIPKTNMELMNNVIDFEDILNKKLQDNVELITQKLDLLSSFIDNIIAEAVPVEAVIDTTDKVFKRILSKN